MPSKHKIPLSLLEAILYNPESGNFLWKIPPEKRRINSKAGWINNYGYVYITFNRIDYSAAILAWTITHGYEPDLVVDHINGNRADNRIGNLRLATIAQNQQNKTIQSNNTSGFPGIYWDKSRCKWRAHIHANGKRYYLGQYMSKTDAVERYIEASIKLHRQFSVFNRELP